jgi:hypothetical protein
MLMPNVESKIMDAAAKGNNFYEKIEIEIDGWNLL